MQLESLVGKAHRAGASDIHLEPGLPLALRVRGALAKTGAPVDGRVLADLARTALGEASWAELESRGSTDLARTIDGVRCRINALRTRRGIGLAIRILTSAQPTLAHLNLHPDLARVMDAQHGLVVLSGSTGSGKSSTLAALAGDLAARETRHIVAIEHPIEYTLAQGQSFVRQREVGRDTPSFGQGVLDAMREDPDILIVGEMRDAETMRLVLNAAETGHLVLTTVHSATPAEALQRIVSAFPAEIQPSICGQLADCLRAVVCQKMTWRADVGVRVPELEVLLATTPARTVIRAGSFHKLTSILDTGQQEGQWSLRRYRAWLDARVSWAQPDLLRVTEDDADDRVDAPAAPLPRSTPPAPKRAPTAVEGVAAEPKSDVAGAKPDVWVIEPAEGSLSDILSELE